MSVWAYPFDGDLTGSFASTREPNGVQKVVQVTTFERGNRTWTSTVTNTTYPLDWTLGLADGTQFTISSQRDDQELAGPGGAFVYEGYIEAQGSYQGVEGATAYGIVEVSPVEASFV